jgi:hypothetical protein
MMTKRLIPLLALTFILTIAPAALADHCERCKPLTQTCVPTLNFGFAICYWDIEGCHTDLPCGDHALPEPEPLAAEFNVASVERLDEPKTAASETLIASVEAPTPAIR